MIVRETSAELFARFCGLATAHPFGPVLYVLRSPARPIQDKTKESQIHRIRCKMKRNGNHHYCLRMPHKEKRLFALLPLTGITEGKILFSWIQADITISQHLFFLLFISLPDSQFLCGKKSVFNRQRT